MMDFENNNNNNKEKLEINPQTETKLFPNSLFI